MQCAPNPASDRTVLTLQNDRIGEAQISIWNQAGQRVGAYQVEKTSPEFTYVLDLNQLPAGTYRVQCSLGTLVHEGSFIKI
jgi:hypothetical protein